MGKKISAIWFGHKNSMRRLVKLYEIAEGRYVSGQRMRDATKKPPHLISSEEMDADMVRSIGEVFIGASKDIVRLIAECDDYQKRIALLEKVIKTITVPCDTCIHGISDDSPKCKLCGIKNRDYPEWELNHKAI
jgi:hypothetical protein